MHSQKTWLQFGVTHRHGLISASTGFEISPCLYGGGVGGVHLKPATLREFQDAGSEGIIQVSVRLTAGENVSEGAFDQ